MEIKIFDLGAGNFTAESVQVKDEIFARDYNEPLIHQVVEAYRAAGRSGTKAQKSRSEVSGGGIKPWRQKGTGRARVGTTRSPLWRTGGVTFAAKPRDFSQKVNKKMYNGAICSILSELLRQERLYLTNSIETTGKTRDFAQKLQQLGWEQLLIIQDPIDLTLYLASRNLPRVDVTDLSGINPLALIGFDKVLFTVDSLKKVEELLS